MFNEDYEEEPELEFGFFYDDLKMLVHHYIDRFFADKEFHSGGPIPNKFLHTERYVNMVLDHDVCNSMDVIYNAVSLTYRPEQLHRIEKKGQLPEDVKYVISLLNHCSSLGVPKAFSTGLVMMYIEICDGCNLAL